MALAAALALAEGRWRGLGAAAVAGDVGRADGAGAVSGACAGGQIAHVALAVGEVAPRMPAAPAVGAVGGPADIRLAGVVGEGNDCGWFVVVAAK